MTRRAGKEIALFCERLNARGRAENGLAACKELVSAKRGDSRKPLARLREKTSVRVRSVGNARLLKVPSKSGSPRSRKIAPKFDSNSRPKGWFRTCGPRRSAEDRRLTQGPNCRSTTRRSREERSSSRKSGRRRGITIRKEREDAPSPRAAPESGLAFRDVS